MPQNQINILIRKISNGYIIILGSGNEIYFSTKKELLERLSLELEMIE